jgi:hypothetical protein
MKNIEKIAFFLVAGWILQLVSRPVWFLFVIKHCQEDPSVGSTFLGYVSLAGSSLIAIGCGIWLFKEAQKEKQGKWMWCLLGLLFQLQAIVIFYLYIILQELRLRRTANQAFDTTS